MEKDIRLNAAAGHVVPQLVEGPSGQLLFSCFKPLLPGIPRRAVLCLPPFAEEMNKSRRMLALQGRQIAQNGTMFLLPDLFGTGDSAGDFGDADHDIWSQDVRFAVEWLYAQDVEDIQLLAVRFGSLLINSFLECTSQEQHKVVLWNPVTSGVTLLNQFLRTKLAAGMRSGENTSISDLREQLAVEGQIEIAGYILSDRMVASIDKLSLERISTRSSLDVLWTETGPMAEGPPLSKTAEVLSCWREKDVEADYRRVKGPQFWMSPEIREAHQLLGITADYFGATT